MSEGESADLYLLCASSPRADDAARIPATAWPGVLERAKAHKVANLAFARWADTVAVVPDEVRAARRWATAQNLAFSGRLIEVLDALDAHHIETLPFKGPLLAELVFGGIANRSFSDLDILVPRQDLLRACQLLVRVGYLPSSGAVLEEEVQRTLRGGHHVVLQHEAHGTCVEVHWEMSGRYLPVALDFATVRPFLGRAAFLDRRVWTLSPEAALLYHCVHGAREYWRILDHVVCVAWQWDRVPPDWDLFLDLAKRWGASQIALTGVGLAAAVFGLELPPSVAGLLARSASVRRLVARQRERILQEDRLTVLRLRYLPEFLRMHWVHLGDPVHFGRWVALRLTSSGAEDVTPITGGEPGGRPVSSPKRRWLRSGILAPRRR